MKFEIHSDYLRIRKNLFIQKIFADTQKTAQTIPVTLYVLLRTCSVVLLNC